MSKVEELSEAKRILLEKCARGEVSFSADPVRKAANQMRQPGITIAQQEAARSTAAAHEGSFGAEFASAGRKGVDSRRPSKFAIRRVSNRILHLLCRFGPGGFTTRPFLHRLRGVSIGKKVWIGDDVYLDNDFPHCIEIQDGAMIELRTIILAHTHGEGKVVIEKNAFIGAGSVIVTAANRTLVIGEGSVIMASSMVNRSVAPYTLYGSDCARPLARITKPFTGTTSYEEFITSLEPLHS
jgi:acetyltransferase-like isoleucine patch superfamily enzyme